jgi:thioredoxin 1
MADAIQATEATFDEEVLGSETPVIVDFWAEWCGPCHMVAPVLDQIVDERGGDVRLVKVNIDEQPALAQRYGVMSIPTMILFRDGEPVAGTLGAQPKSSLERALGLEIAAA